MRLIKILITLLFVFGLLISIGALLLTYAFNTLLVSYDYKIRIIGMIISLIAFFIGFHISIVALSAFRRLIRSGFKT